MKSSGIKFCVVVPLLCVLRGLSPIREDVPDDTVVALAKDELEGALLSRVAAARAPASRARKLGAAVRDEGPDAEDLPMSGATMGLPGAVPTYACHDIFDCTEVLAIARRIPSSTIPQSVVEGTIAIGRIQRRA